MSVDAMLPCLVCGATLKNSFAECENQPNDGTEFSTYGHYGSTFWDSFDGEELVLNVCDACLRMHKDRLGQRKRYIPLEVRGIGQVGRQYVDRPMVPYTGSPDNTRAQLSPDEIGTIEGDRIEWCENVVGMRAYALELEAREDARRDPSNG